MDKGGIDLPFLIHIRDECRYQHRDYMYYMKRNNEEDDRSAVLEEIKSKKEVAAMRDHVESTNEKILRLVLSRADRDGEDVLVSPLKPQSRGFWQSADSDDDDYDDYLECVAYKGWLAKQPKNCGTYVACSTLSTCTLDCIFYSHTSVYNLQNYTMTLGRPPKRRTKHGYNMLDF